MPSRLAYGLLGFVACGALFGLLSLVGSSSELRARAVSGGAPLPRTVERVLRWPTPPVLFSEPLESRRPPSEEAYLRVLQEFARTDRARALAYVERGEGWFGEHGVSAEARRALRVTLLVDLDRMSEARAFTREFLERYPTSEYRRLVQGVTGLHSRPGPPAHLVGR